MLIRPTDIHSNEFRTVSRQTVSAVLIATPEAARSLAQDDLLYQHNEGKQISENQYFHVDTSLFLTYYIQKPDVNQEYTY